MFDYCLYFNTTALARLLEREWTKAFHPFGLTPSQAFMLRAILDKPGMLQRELAKTLTIARPTATRLLDGLEAKGLVVREATAHDGRESALQPTAKAKGLKTKLNAESAKVTQRLKKALGTDYFDQTVTQIKEICTVLK